MNEHDTPSSEVQLLTAALEKAGISPDCPACGCGEWLPLETLAQLPINPPPTTVVTVGIVCTRCGLVRLHAAQVLDQYMDPRDH